MNLTSQLINPATFVAFTVLVIGIGIYLRVTITNHKK